MEKVCTPNRLTRSSARHTSKQKSDGHLEQNPAEEFKHNLRKTRRKTETKISTNGDNTTHSDSKNRKSTDDLSDGNSLDTCDSENKVSPKSNNVKTVSPIISRKSLRTRRSVTPGPELETIVTRKLKRSTSEGKLNAVNTTPKRINTRAQSESKDFVFTPTKQSTDEKEMCSEINSKFIPGNKGLNAIKETVEEENELEFNSSLQKLNVAISESAFPCVNKHKDSQLIESLKTDNNFDILNVSGDKEKLLGNDDCSLQMTVESESEIEIVSEATEEEVDRMEIKVNFKSCNIEDIKMPLESQSKEKHSKSATLNKSSENLLITKDNNSPSKNSTVLPESEENTGATETLNTSVLLSNVAVKGKPSEESKKSYGAKSSDNEIEKETTLVITTKKTCGSLENNDNREDEESYILGDQNPSLNISVPGKFEKSLVMESENKHSNLKVIATTTSECSGILKHASPKNITQSKIKSPEKDDDKYESKSIECDKIMSPCDKDGVTQLKLVRTLNVEINDELKQGICEGEINKNDVFPSQDVKVKEVNDTENVNELVEDKLKLQMEPNTENNESTLICESDSEEPTYVVELSTSKYIPESNMNLNLQNEDCEPTSPPIIADGCDTEQVKINLSEEELSHKTDRNVNYELPDSHELQDNLHVDVKEGTIEDAILDEVSGVTEDNENEIILSNECINEKDIQSMPPEGPGQRNIEKADKPLLNTQYNSDSMLVVELIDENEYPYPEKASEDGDGKDIILSNECIKEKDIQSMPPEEPGQRNIEKADKPLLNTQYNSDSMPVVELIDENEYPYQEKASEDGDGKEIILSNECIKEKDIQSMPPEGPGWRNIEKADKPLLNSQYNSDAIPVVELNDENEYPYLEKASEDGDRKGIILSNEYSKEKYIQSMPPEGPGQINVEKADKPLLNNQNSSDLMPVVELIDETEYPYSDKPLEGGDENGMILSSECIKEKDIQSMTPEGPGQINVENPDKPLLDSLYSSDSKPVEEIIDETDNLYPDNASEDGDKNPKESSNEGKLCNKNMKDEKKTIKIISQSGFSYENTNEEMGKSQILEEKLWKYGNSEDNSNNTHGFTDENRKAENENSNDSDNNYLLKLKNNSVHGSIEDESVDSELYKGMSDFGSDVDDSKKEGSQYDESSSSESKPDNSNEDESSLDDKDSLGKSKNGSQLQVNESLKCNTNSEIVKQDHIKEFDTSGPMTYDKVLAVLNKDRVKKIDDEEFFDMFTQELNRVSEESGSDSDIAIVDEYIAEPEEENNLNKQGKDVSQSKKSNKQKNATPIINIKSLPKRCILRPKEGYKKQMQTNLRVNTKGTPKSRSTPNYSQSQNVPSSYDPQSQRGQVHHGLEQMNFSHGGYYHQYNEGMQSTDPLCNQFDASQSNLQASNMFNFSPENYVSGNMYAQMHYSPEQSMKVRNIESMCGPSNVNLRSAVPDQLMPVHPYNEADYHRLPVTPATMTESFSDSKKSSVLEILGLDKKRLKMLKKALGLDEINKKQNNLIELLGGLDTELKSPKAKKNKFTNDFSHSSKKKQKQLSHDSDEDYSDSSDESSSEESVKYDKTQLRAVSKLVSGGLDSNEENYVEKTRKQAKGDCRSINLQDGGSVSVTVTRPKRKPRHRIEIRKLSGSSSNVPIATLKKTKRGYKLCEPSENENINQSKKFKKEDNTNIMSRTFYRKPRHRTLKAKVRTQMSSLIFTKCGTIVVDPVTSESETDSLSKDNSDMMYKEQLKRSLLTSGKNKLSNMFGSLTEREKSTKRKNTASVGSDEEQSEIPKTKRLPAHLLAHFGEENQVTKKKKEDVATEIDESADCKPRKRRTRRRNAKKIKLSSAVAQQEYIPLVTAGTTQFGLQRLDKDGTLTAIEKAAKFRSDHLYGASVKRITNDALLSVKKKQQANALANKKYGRMCGQLNK